MKKFQDIEMTFQERKAKYLPLLASTCGRAGFPPEYLVSIAHVESGFDPTAEVLSGADGYRGGAYGLCQLTFKTAESLGYAGDASGLLYPDVNAMWAMKLTAVNGKRVGNGILDLAACHNSGKGYANAPYVAQSYAQHVLQLCDLYRDACSQYAKK